MAKIRINVNIIVILSGIISVVINIYIVGTDFIPEVSTYFDYISLLLIMIAGFYQFKVVKKMRSSAIKKVWKIVSIILVSLYGSLLILFSGGMMYIYRPPKLIKKIVTTVNNSPLKIYILKSSELFHQDGCVLYINKGGLTMDYWDSFPGANYLKYEMDKQKVDIFFNGKVKLFWGKYPDKIYTYNLINEETSMKELEFE